MADFINSVDVKTLVNIYCDGKVQSRTLRYPDGKLQTLGVYLPGEFEFHSEGPEKVIMTAGAGEVLFPEDNDWRRVETGECYDVPADTMFKVRCGVISEYICDFL
ncbi:pyrimidine/purine nucleoside phosphorylase [Cloacibacillus evryensis]|uniref:pyrimidine/purine nucleoside phosphorylase n=1 Tax=Cloacibacillus evryensis TaxID=508460 RepID=UPI00241F41FA|nr:pyrimidine/purine nucleoside phosphorylase [Cloacibacillus evryensis]